MWGGGSPLQNKILRTLPPLNAPTVKNENGSLETLEAEFWEQKISWNVIFGNHNVVPTATNYVFFPAYANLQTSLNTFSPPFAIYMSVVRETNLIILNIQRWQCLSLSGKSELEKAIKMLCIEQSGSRTSRKSPVVCYKHGWHVIPFLFVNIKWNQLVRTFLKKGFRSPLIDGLVDLKVVQYQ